VAAGQHMVFYLTCLHYFTETALGGHNLRHAPRSRCRLIVQWFHLFSTGVTVGGFATMLKPQRAAQYLALTLLMGPAALGQQITVYGGGSVAIGITRHLTEYVQWRLPLSIDRCMASSAVVQPMVPSRQMDSTGRL